jgi:hypothetical protein
MMHIPLLHPRIRIISIINTGRNTGVVMGSVTSPELTGFTTSSDSLSCHSTKNTIFMVPLIKRTGLT